jgi:hypothetical protein
MQTKGPNGLAVALYFTFKTIPATVAGFSIYLGYRLFILGVTGQASLSIQSQTISGQLANAAPGLFFAIGGFAALIASILKGVELNIDGDNSLAVRSLKAGSQRPDARSNAV